MGSLALAWRCPAVLVGGRHGARLHSRRQQEGGTEPTAYSLGRGASRREPPPPPTRAADTEPTSTRHARVTNL